MKKLVLVVLLTILPGCALLGPVEPVAPIGVPSTLPEAGKQAQNAINEANVGLAAAANVIAANVRDGIYTKAQAQAYLDQVKDYARKIDRAQEAVKLGDFSSAQGQADAVRSLILILHREVAAQARKEGAK
jgi:hypothetical protein